MLALEISVNDSTTTVVAADNHLLASINCGSSDRNELDRISVFGWDDASSYTWLDEKIQNGDKILIRVIEVEKDKVSSPKRMNMKNREWMKQEFERLKMELQNKHLL